MHYMDEIQKDMLNELIKKHTKEVEVEERLTTMKEVKDEEIEINKIVIEVLATLCMVQKNQLRKEYESLGELTASYLSILESTHVNEEALLLELHHKKNETEAIKKITVNLQKRLQKNGKKIVKLTETV